MREARLLEREWRLSPFVRLVPPGAMANSGWLAVHLMSKKTWALGRHGAALGLMLATPLTGERATELVHRRSGAERAALEAQFHQLVELGVFVDAVGHREDAWAEELLVQWRDHGWVEAADYHLMSFDYRFFDYSDNGWDKDLETMRAYRAEEPDLLRFKSRAEGTTGFLAPPVMTVLETMDAEFTDCLRGPVRAAKLDRAGVLDMMSALFGVTVMTMGKENFSPMIRRTSPSGGSRHPSEGYVCVFDVVGLDPGWYHFSCGTSELVKVSELDADRAQAAFYGAFRAKFDIRAIVLVTSQLERNMYRYREPRTFRTPFMDVGHLVTTATLVAHAQGFALHSHHGMDDAYLEGVLGLDPLEEPAVYSIALGDGVTAVHTSPSQGA